jgi:hypothetical protein
LEYLDEHEDSRTRKSGIDLTDRGQISVKSRSSAETERIRTRSVLRKQDPITAYRPYLSQGSASRRGQWRWVQLVMAFGAVARNPERVKVDVRPMQDENLK